MIFFALSVMFVLGGCDDQRLQTVKWIEYEPVYMTQEEFANAVSLDAPRDISDPGKIYYNDGYLYVNEVNKGIHIIDNRDPASPSIVGFVTIPANKDLAVSGDRLYADSNSDLLVFDISNKEDVELITRKENVFSNTATHFPGFPYQPVDPARGIVVDWEPVEMEEVCEGDCYHPRGGIWFAEDNLRAFGVNTAGSGGAAGGVGGSMARFAIAGEYLYAVDDWNLLTFDIATPEPGMVSQKNVGWSIETIFPYADNLFIGSSNAMYIYDISIPDAPAQLSVYTHLTACDPVVVEGDRAYVTLRESERCPRGVNRLEIIDVADRTNPEKLAFYEMISPYGLGIDDGYLFVSEGEHGLKIMDAHDPYNVQQLRHIKGIETYDVIPLGGVLMVTGGSGIVQYDYSDIENLKHLSTIPVTPGD